MLVLSRFLIVILSRVDNRIWCFAAQFLMDCWNLTVRRTYRRGESSWEGLSPREIIEKEYPDGIALPGAASLDDLRRFGCLCWVMVTKDPKEEAPKLAQKVQT